MSKSPAGILMGHGGTQSHGSSHNRHAHRLGFAKGGYVEGGSTVPLEGEAKPNASGGRMNQGGRYADGGARHVYKLGLAKGGYVEGGSTVPLEGEAKPNASGGRMNQGGRYADGGAMAPMGRSFGTSRPFAEGGEPMRRGGHRRRHHASGDIVSNNSGHHSGEAQGTMAEGGKLRRGGRGRRHHHAEGNSVNPHTGHPQYFAAAAALAPLLMQAAPAVLSAIFGRGNSPRNEGGYAAGGETMSRGGHRRRHHHADGGSAWEGGLQQDQNTPTMKCGGRRRYHAEGGDTEGLHRAMGGAGKSRKHYPYT